MKTMAELSETEWTVFHAAMDAEQEGLEPSISVIVNKLPDLHSETVRRTRHRLARWGIIRSVILKPREYGRREIESLLDADLTCADLDRIDIRLRESPSSRPKSTYLRPDCSLPTEPSDVIGKLAAIETEDFAGACQEILRIIQTSGVRI